LDKFNKGFFIMKTIAIVGGGITGVTTAYALAKRGFSVTLFERHRYVAMETSFANGGQLSASNAEVWTHWSTILKGMKWMLKNDAPLLVNPKPSWHKRLYSHEETGNGFTYARDLKVAAWCQVNGVAWKEFAQFGVVRRLKSRNVWQSEWERHMSSPIQAVNGLIRYGSIGDLWVKGLLPSF
jgi:glycine/D-amino acid oxidase-like deaminating enzyme